MFKLTGSSGRRAAGSSGVPKVARADSGGPSSVSAHPQPGVVAFQPASPQEHGFDSNSPRLSGLEK